MGHKIAIIGAGHAGVEAARVAAEAGADVTLFSDEHVLPYYRPRLVTVAFHEADGSDIRMHPADWYADRRIEVRLDARVERIDAAALVIHIQGREERFDGMILANGSVPMMPPFGTNLPERVMTLWNLGQAEAIRQRVKRGGHLVVVGGGILGLETALRAAQFGMRVIIVELADRLMPLQFGKRTAGVLLKTVKEKGIEVELGRRIVAASVSQAAGTLRITLEAGRELESDLCVVTIGARPDLSVGTASALAHDRGIVVNEYMQTSAARVFAAGDVAQLGGVTRCSIREAVAKGKIAGANLMGSLDGQPMTAHVPTLLPVSLKARDFELYAIGEPVAPDDRELWLEGGRDSVVRSILLRDDVVVGVQMVGTREGFDELAGGLGQKLNEQGLYRTET